MEEEEEEEEEDEGAVEEVVATPQTCGSRKLLRHITISSEDEVLMPSKPNIFRSPWGPNRHNLLCPRLCKLTRR